LEEVLREKGVRGGVHPHARLFPGISLIV